MNHLPQRRSIRLPNYDYSSQGLYYVTICTQNRELYFDRNDIRQIIEQCWLKISEHFSNIKLDEWIVMPNHIHGIIVINSAGRRRGEPLWSPVDKEPIYLSESKNKHVYFAGNHKGYPYNEAPRLGDMIGAFKSITTHSYIQEIKTKDWPRFDKKLWQRNYYEHIIRTQKSLEDIRKYIRFNPYNWDRDRNNPKNWK